MHRKLKLTIKARIYNLFGSMFTMFSKGGAVAKNVYSVSRRVGGTPPSGIDVSEGSYSVVNVSDLSLARSRPGGQHVDGSLRCCTASSSPPIPP